MEKAKNMLRPVMMSSDFECCCAPAMEWNEDEMFLWRHGIYMWPIQRRCCLLRLRCACHIRKARLADNH